MRPLVGPALLATLLLFGCQQPAPKVYEVESGRTYAAERSELSDRLSRFLAGQGIEPTAAGSAPGVIDATDVWDGERGWADCEAAWVRDRGGNNNRTSRARRGEQRVDLRVTLAETGTAGETRAEVAARFTERQTNPFTNTSFRQRCRSTGELERALLDALEA
jgi:hypothetical protein